MKRILYVTALLVALIAGGLATASEPASLVTAVIPNDPGLMPGENISIIVELTNGYDEPVQIAYDNTKAPDREDEPILFVWPPVLKMPAGSKATIEIFGRAHAAGKFAMMIRGAVSDPEGLEKYDTFVPLFLRVAEEGRAENLVAQLEEYESLFHESLESIDGIGEAFPVERGIGGIPDPTGGEEIFLPAEPEEPQADAQLKRLMPRGDAFTQVIQGQYRWLDTKGKIQPAAGWRAALFVGALGTYVDTGLRDTVGNDASFHFTLKLAAKLPALASARVVLYPSNRYFDLLNSKGKKYQFVFPTFNIGNGESYDYGPWWIDLNQTAPGLGELHRSGYDLYSKLMNANFSPLRDKPIRVIYPGTDDCGSCTLNGTVHIEVAKATNNRTIKHELGHELMYEYWGGMPDGSGGYHEWPKCASKGLALSEGFAHFVSWWANVERDLSGGSWGMSYNGEALASSVCKDIQKNELRVAATFWDLHDTKVDGVDLYTNASKARILEMILGGGNVRDSYIELMYPRLETTGGLEWWRIAPISEMNYTK
ncbi:MAG TPA: hypothetical protein VHW00_16895 [Thermoanaerobaculia bacterium]|nr:hypothetical protein [Thermoanaerobaculia bacterium]